MSRQCIIHERGDYKYVISSKAYRFATLKSFEMKIAQQFGGLILFSIYFII